MAELLLAMVICVLFAYYVTLVTFSRRVEHAPFVIAILALIPYWTLVGSLSTLVGKLDDPLAQGNYLESRLFKIRADGDYLITLVSYSFFMFLVLAIVLAMAPRVTRKHPFDSGEWRRLARHFPHPLLLAVLYPLLMFAILTVIRGQSRAGESALYLSDYHNLGRLFTYVNVGTTGALSVGIALLIVAGSVTRRRNALAWAGYIGAFLAVLWINFATGQRGFLLATVLAIAVGTLWLGGEGFIRQHKKATLAVLAVTPLLLLLASVPGVTRNRYVGATAQDQLARFIEGLGNGPVLLQSWLRSGEQFAAHSSLYGVVSREAPWPSLNFSSSYGQYAMLVDAPQDQGFTIHQVAAWWLYVGPLAPMAAALVVGGSTLLLLRISRISPASQWAPLAVCAGMLPAIGLPMVLLRGGPENLWGLSLTMVILPGLMLMLPTWLARRGVVSRDGNAPALLPAGFGLGEPPGNAPSTRGSETSDACKSTRQSDSEMQIGSEMVVRGDGGGMQPIRKEGSSI